MPRVLIVGVPLRDADDHLTWVAESRGGRLAAALARRGHQLVLVGPHPDGLFAGSRRGASPEAVLAEGLAGDGDRLVFPLPAGAEARGDVLHDILRRAAPDVVIGVGLGGCLAAAEVPSAPPRWLDLSADLPVWEEAPEPSAASQEGELGRRSHYRRLGLLLENGDRYSCDDDHRARKLRVHLGLRGRVSDNGDELVSVMDDDSGSDALAPLLAWVEAPARGPVPAPLAGSREAELVRRIDDLERELMVMRGTRLFRLRARVLGMRRHVDAVRARRPVKTVWEFLVFYLIVEPRHALARGLKALARRSADAAVWPFLVLGTGWRLLRASWRRRTAAEPSSKAAPRTAAVASEARRPKILVVSPYVIHPPHHGGGIRLFNLIRQLSDRCDLYLLIFLRGADDPEQRAALAPYCKRVEFHSWTPNFDRHGGSLRPPNVQLFWDPRLAQRIRDLVAIHGIDVVQLECIETAPYSASCGPARVALAQYDIGFLTAWRRRRAGFRRRFPDSRAFGATLGDWMRLLRYEIRVCARLDQVHVMSEHDRSFLGSFLPRGTEGVRVVPNAVDTAAFAPPRPPEDGPGARDGVLLVGNFEHLPNVDAFDHLVQDVWPLVRERRPDATLTVVGAAMPERLRSHDGADGIRVVGEVPDLRPYYHEHRVVAVPIRAGSGTRLKLFEAFASAIPAVSTALGAEGIELENGRHLLVADGAEALAEAILRLLEDDDLWTRVAAEAIAHARQDFDWSVAAERLLDGWQSLITGLPRAAGLPESTASAGVEHEVGDAEVVPEISVVIPTLDGGERLEAALRAIGDQQCARHVEILCVDSQSCAEDRAMMQRLGARIVDIERRDFNHGLTRDLGAAHARGRVLVFLNQDAVPASESWLAELTEPLFGVDPPAAVQGGIAEFPHGTQGVPRFFWDSCGERFYFTRESSRWLRRFDGLGFSTVNAAIRREVWDDHPFGWAPIMEDKKWQRAVIEAGHEIAVRGRATVLHTHDYDLRTLTRRCRSEGFGWRFLGERYSIADMARDWLQPKVWAELVRGVARGRVRSRAALLFPWLRPWMLWVGNRWSRDVAL